MATGQSNDGYDFDLLTLGAGSGGVAASRRAAALGARVAVIEQSRVGGTCVIRGCVPKKLLMYAAQFGDLLGEARGYGWRIDDQGFSMAQWAASKAAEIDRLEGVYRRMLDGSKVALIEGRGHVVDPHTVEVGGRRIRAKHLLIATGARPAHDALPGLAHCATSDDLLDLHELPARAAVIGGGYIAVEFASMLARLGVEVHMFYRAELPLRGFDDDMRRRAAQALQQAGLTLHAGRVPKRIERSGEMFTLQFADGEPASFPFVLNATGRRPNTEGLGLDTVGVELARNGAVRADARGATKVAGVWAIGDVTDRLNLTPVAIAQGRALAERLFAGGTREVDLSSVATAVFMLPPLATIGLTEAKAREQGLGLKIFEADFRPMKQAFIDGKERCYMKLLVDAASDRVVGIHMLGADAPEIMQSLAVAVSCGATKAQFDRTIAMHPTAAEEFVLMREPSREVAAAA